MNFPLKLNYDGEIVRKMGPRSLKFIRTENRLSCSLPWMLITWPCEEPEVVPGILDKGNIDGLVQERRNSTLTHLSYVFPALTKDFGAKTFI